MELYALTSLHSPKQQGEVALQAYVASVSFKCFRCFKLTLQVYVESVSSVQMHVSDDCLLHVVYVAIVYLNVAVVYLDVATVI